MPDLGLYIHIPFCARKCSYCDFNSYAGREGLITPYIDALLTEFEDRSRELGAPTFTTAYLGGGTPTLLSIRQLSRLLQGVTGAAPLAADAEVTVEANPGAVDAAKLGTLRALGVNRLSLGVQSFRDEDLRVLGRIHTVAEAEEAFAEARAAGFDDISIDLIYAIPEQSSAHWRLCLQRALALRPEHISTYALTLAEHTPLAAEIGSGRLRAAGESLELRMYQAARRLLQGGGYEHYEISNFAQPGRQCRHNLLYWRRKAYLGIGAGAHSYIHGTRSANVCDPAQYIERIARGESPGAWQERLSADRALGEAIMLGLRLREGVEFAALKERFGTDVRERFADDIAELREAGLLKVTRDRMAVTARGLALADEVALRFIGKKALSPVDSLAEGRPGLV